MLLLVYDIFIISFFKNLHSYYYEKLTIVSHSSYTMGYKEQNERKRISAAKTCQSLNGWCTKKQTENHNQSLNENAPNTKTVISKQRDSIDSPPAKISRATKQSDSEPLAFTNDVGKILNATMNYEELSMAMRTLDDSQKFFLLNNHFKPPIEYIFPSPFLHKCQSQFKARYLTDYKWMVYSPLLNGAYCIHCSVMIPISKR